ncbi:MAG: 4Fe-4S dicluster domain-containing protein [Candidatus Helarchaeota archaeon]|nr:4Fe-4S dicluster domain-containing protein [Candidatus Helarchaeota archaeon]
MIRKIIKIDEDLCTGCGECIPNCPEQAIELVDTPKGKKARIVKDFYCDGLGACLGVCPVDAISIEEREAEPYDDDATMDRIKEVAPEMLEIHKKHMAEHGMGTPEEHIHAHPHEFGGCPGSQTLHWEKTEETSTESVRVQSELQQWPIQLHLVSPFAPYFQNADLAFIADCVGFTSPNFHQDILKGKAIAVCCPKLDDIKKYSEKIAQIIKTSNPRSITVYHMEVPCCFGLTALVKEAAEQARSEVPIEEVVIGIKGDQKVVSATA